MTALLPPDVVNGFECQVFFRALFVSKKCQICKKKIENFKKNAALSVFLHLLKRHVHVIVFMYTIYQCFKSNIDRPQI